MANQPLNTDLLDRAILFAVKAHASTERRGKGYPYIIHPLEAVEIVATMTADQELLAAAALHDTVEDTDVTVEQIRMEFGERVASLVAAESDEMPEGVSEAESWHARKQAAIDRLAHASHDAKMVALGDKLSNMRAIARDHAEIGDMLWSRFHAKDPKDHEWHYRGLLEALRELEGTFAYKEFETLVNQVFQLKSTMENQKFIITINRECGTGGGEIARLLGEKLGVKVYGRTMLKAVAKQFGTTLEELDRIKAQKSNWWNEFCRFYQQFGAASYVPGSIADPTPMSVYCAEERLLHDLAEKESCIIVGRAGFHIFRNHPNAIHLLLIADRDARIARIAQKQSLTLDEAAKVVDDVDNARDNFVKTVAETSRHDARNYHVCVNITGLQPETVADFLAQQIRQKPLNNNHLS